MVKPRLASKIFYCVLTFTFLVLDPNTYFAVNILTKNFVLFQGGFDQVSLHIPGPSISRSAGNQNEIFIELGTTKRKISSL